METQALASGDLDAMLRAAADFASYPGNASSFLASLWFEQIKLVPLIS
jgi:hypothetical protein